MVVSILGKEHSKHVKLSSFSARFFLMFGLDNSEVMFFSGKQNMTWKKTPLFWEKMNTGMLFFLASEDSAVQSLNEVDHSDMTEKPVAAEDVVLVGFSTLLTWDIINVRLAFYGNYTFKSRTQW